MEQKVKIADVQKIINSQRKDIITITYSDETSQEQIHMQIYPQISLMTRNAIINGICDFVLGDSVKTHEIEEYQPELLNFSRRYAVITNLTNLTLPEDNDEIYELVMNTNVYDEVLKAVGRSEIFSMFAEADDKMNFYKELIVASQRTKIISEFVNKLTNFAADKFKDFDIEELKNVMSKLKDVDASKIVETILNTKHVG